MSHISVDPKAKPDKENERKIKAFCERLGGVMVFINQQYVFAYWLYGKCMVVAVGTIRQGVVPQRNVPL